MEDRSLKELDQRLAPARKAWRDSQDRLMRAELSPLGRVDYLHLTPGEHRIGTDPAAGVRVRAESLAPYAGEVYLTVAGGRMSLRAAPAVAVSGRSVESRALRPEDVVAIGALRLLVLGTPTDPQIAVYDLKAPARVGYAGLHYYPDHSRYAVLARLQRHDKPSQIRVDVSRGGPRDMDAVGVLHFQIDGAAYSLEAFKHDGKSDDLFVIFKDRTNGQPGGSYGAGRFLYTKVLPGDQVLLDFNQAWNPYCAYSAYFHCPLPPRSNWLAVELPVGEKDPGIH